MKVVWMGLRTGREKPVEVTDKVEVKPGKGHVNDRFSGRTESLAQVSPGQGRTPPSLQGQPSIEPSLLPRNIRGTSFPKKPGLFRWLGVAPYAGISEVNVNFV